jgi:hypothetical protein
MWFNSMIREEPYPGLNAGCIRQRCFFPSRDRQQGAAWLSSARAARCRVKSHNERNPCRQLPPGQAGDSGGTAAARREEGGDDVKSSRPLRPGLHTCYNGQDRGQLARERWRIRKPAPSSDRSLQPDSVKLESLVIAHQHGAVNTFPGLVHTARQAMEAGGA